MEVFSNSRLVVGQVRDELEARDARMQEYLGQVKRLQSNFEFFNLTHVSRSGKPHMQIHWPLLLRLLRRIYHE